MADDLTRMPSAPGAIPTGQSSWKDVPLSLQELYQQSMGGLRDQLATGYTPYSGPRIAGLSGMQQSAIDMAGRDIPWIESQYGKAADALGGYKPMTAAQVSAPGGLGAATWQAPTIDSPRADLGRLGQVYNPNISQQQMQLSTGRWPSHMQEYMSPYTQAVTQEIARLGNQNLQENILPGVNSTFTGQGQFGSTRNADFMNRALRDAQREILGRQSQALESGYGTSANIFGADEGRSLQAQQGTASNLLGLGNLGLQANTAANQAYLAGIGQNQSAAQVQAELQARAAAGNAAAQNQMGQFNTQNQMQANLSNAGFQQQANLTNMAAPLALSGAYQNLGASGAGALAQLAAMQSGLGQTQQATTQKSLDQAYQDFMNQKNWNLQNTGNVINAANTIAPNVTGSSVGYGFSSPGTSTAQNWGSGVMAAAGLYDAYNKANPDTATPQQDVTRQGVEGLPKSLNPANNQPQARTVQNVTAAGSSFNPTATDIRSWQESQGLGMGQADLLTGTSRWNRANPTQQVSWDQVNKTMGAPNAYSAG